MLENNLKTIIVRCDQCKAEGTRANFEVTLFHHDNTLKLGSTTFDICGRECLLRYINILAEKLEPNKELSLIIKNVEDV